MLCIFCFGLEVAGVFSLADCLPKSLCRSDLLDILPWTLQELQEQLRQKVLALLWRICCLMLPWSCFAGGPRGSTAPADFVASRAMAGLCSSRGLLPFEWHSLWELLNCWGGEDWPPWFRSCLQIGTRWGRLSWSSQKHCVQLPGWNSWIRKREKVWQSQEAAEEKNQKLQKE